MDQKKNSLKNPIYTRPVQICFFLLQIYECRSVDQETMTMYAYMDTLEMILNSLCDTDAESGLGPIENIEMWIP